jgi:hypothetical protein
MLFCFIAIFVVSDKINLFDSNQRYRSTNSSQNYSNKIIADTSDIYYLPDKFDWATVNPSKMLTGLNEPILHNKYLGYDMIRFTIFNHYGDQILSVKNDGGTVFLHWTFIENNRYPKAYWDTAYSANIHFASKNLGLEEWGQVTGILDSIDFWQMDYFMGDTTPFKHEGNVWVIEAHFKARYKVVKAVLPPESLFRVADYFMNTAGLWDNTRSKKLYMLARERLEIIKKYPK